MLAIKRLEVISQLLSENGSVDATQLSERFDVTPKTIRKDLDKLENLGLLDRVHGGAVLKRTDTSVLPIEQRKLQNVPEKRRIGMAALDFVQEGDTIIIDGGSTTLELARLLGEKRILAITGDLKIAMELMNKTNVDLFVTGGHLRRDSSYTLLGRDAERVLEKYKAKKVFLGTTGLDLENGLSVLNSDEAEVKKAMISAAQEVICLVDYSKFNHVAFAPFCAMEKIDVLITDSRIPPAEREALQRRGITVHAV